MAFKWNFPLNNYAEIRGFNDSGIATFGSSAYASLAREICQNSLDAGLENKTVIIEFEKFYLPREKFPEVEYFNNILSLCETQCKNYVKDQKPREFFKESISIISRDRIPFLRISDYNTTGLRGSDKEYNTDWINLVKATGSSDKGSQSGGSFGIGKAAPFVCSSLRTVFYSTIDDAGYQATQGISKLISFKMNESDGDYTQGIGYYGEEQRNSPIRECLSFQADYKRLSSGTDIYIAGFIEDDDWKVSIISEILNNYFYAIFKGVLEIIVDGEKINSETLSKFIDKYCSLESNDRFNPTKHYYEVLTFTETIWFTENFKNYGQIKLGLLMNREEDSLRKVAMIRKPWMKIKDYRPGIMASFAGVFIVEGSELNSFLRKLENPSHNDWEAGRAKNKHEQDTAKRLLRDINKFIRDKLNEIYNNTEIDSEDVYGLADIIPLEDDDNTSHNKSEDMEKDYLAPKVSNISKKAVNPSTKRKKQKSEGDYLSFEEEDYGKLVEGDGTFIYEHNEGKRGEGSRPGDEAKGIDAGSEVVLRPTSITPIDLRLICLKKQENLYRVIFKSNVSANDCSMTISQLDEQGAKFPITILKAIKEGQELHVNKNRISYFEVDKEEIVQIDFIVDIKTYFSAEVNLYGFEK